ncbi:MAG: asparagine synthase, partial [Gammaproteobacteria bacterium]|nr:asparagine synthase [Gammaproteobacteria bacterium]
DDRLRGNRVGVFMSGGLDSSSVAATAHAILRRRGHSGSMKAFSIVYDRLIPDQERRYAGLVASHLEISIECLGADGYPLYGGEEKPECNGPEPSCNPFWAVQKEILNRACSYARVALTGWDGDTLLDEPPGPYIRTLLKGMRLGRLTAGLGRYLLSQRRLPPLGLSSRLKRFLHPREEREPPFPAWINPDLSRRLDLQTRWQDSHQQHKPGNPLRPHASEALSLSFLWSDLFEGYAPGHTGVPLEARHPWADLRLIDYLLSIPPLPWCAHKMLLREAMRGA